MAFQQRGAKLMVSYGGKIIQERYIGGEHRLVEVSRDATLADLRSRLAAFSSGSEFSIRYGFSVDALRRVTTEDDVRCVLDWVMHRDLLVHLHGKDPATIRRVRVFLVDDDDLPPLIDLDDTVIAPSSQAPPPSSLSLIDIDTLIAPSTPPPSFSAKPPLVTPRTTYKRVPSEPSLSTAEDRTISNSKPMFSPAALCRRVASAPSLSATEDDESVSSTTSAVSSVAPSCNVAAFRAYRGIMASPAPVFLVPVPLPPVVVYQPVVFVVPAFSCGMVPRGIV